MRAIEKKLRERNKYLEKRLEEVEADRRKLREHFIVRFKWWIKLLGEKSGPNLSWLVEDEAQWLRKFENWYW